MDLTKLTGGIENVSRTIIRIEKIIKKNKENFCFAALVKRAYRMAIIKSFLLSNIDPIYLN